MSDAGIITAIREIERYIDAVRAGGGFDLDSVDRDRLYQASVACMQLRNALTHDAPRLLTAAD